MFLSQSFSLISINFPRSKASDPCSVIFKEKARIQRNLIDPASSIDSLNELTQQPEIFASGLFDGFSQTFSSRLVGTLVGNVIAIFLLKLVSDWIWQTARNKYTDFIDSITRPFKSTPQESKSNNFMSKISGNQENFVSDTFLSPSAYLTLLFCILIDFGGEASFLLPGVGEAEDVAWAPLSAFLLSNIFGSNVITSLDFIKEILPGSDILPVAVIAWILKYKYPNSEAAKYLGLSKEDKKK